jgi:hypothetical protein
MMRLITLLLMLFAVPAAAAQPRLDAADLKAIRAAVSAQLDAFAHDDGPKAFSYATSDIRQQFGDPDTFLAMVRHNYAVVYRPASVTFLVPLQEYGEVLQQVRMTDASGGVWLARYHMERQPDGRWLIAGCDLARIEGRAT